MEKIELDIDTEKALRPLSWREKVGIRLLLVVFAIVYPAKYTHQIREVFSDIFAGSPK